MLTLVINLAGSEARLAAAAAQLDAAGIVWERLPAVDGRGRSPGDFPGYDAIASRRDWGRDLSGGEIGCYLSHVAALDRFLASDHRLALVLEDDFRLTPAAPGVLAALEAADAAGALGNWALANLTRRPGKFFRPLPVPVPGGTLGRAEYFPTWATALLWTRAGAAEFLAAHRTIRGPYDEILRDHFSRHGGGLGMRPPPIPPTPGDSDVRTADAGRRPGAPARARLRRRAANYPPALARWLAAGLRRRPRP